MKKLTNLILMSSVVLWNKRNEKKEENGYNEMIQNLKNKMNNLENNEYNYNVVRYYKQKIRRLKKLKKLYQNRNKNKIVSYNIVSSKKVFGNVSNCIQTKNLIKIKKIGINKKVNTYNNSERR